MESVRCVSASAPGKVILFGEHAVVHGQPAIAAALSELRIHVKATTIRGENSDTIGDNNNWVDISMPDLPNDVRLKVPGPDLIVEKLQITDATEKIPMTAPTPQDAHHIRTTLLSAMEKTSTQTNNVVLDEMSLSALIPLVYLLNILMRDHLVSSDEHVTTEVVVRSDRLPVGAGLGSSAAFGVASAAALWQLSPYSTTRGEKDNKQPTKEDLNVINQLALYSETLVHGTPSGLDNTVSTFGGAVCYTKDVLHQTVTLEPLWSPSSSPEQEEQLLHILLTNTHVPRSTKKLVSHVRSQLAQHPTVVGPILDAMGAISRQFRDLMNKSQLASSSEQDVMGKSAEETTATLIDINQALLQSVGVSHPSLETVCALTKHLGASTKLTGAGGGGCCMTFLPDPRLGAEIRAAIEGFQGEWNFSCLESSVGGSGVLYTDPTDFPESSPPPQPTHKRHTQYYLSCAKQPSTWLLATSAAAALMFTLRPLISRT